MQVDCCPRLGPHPVEGPGSLPNTECCARHRPFEIEEAQATSGKRRLDASPMRRQRRRAPDPKGGLARGAQEVGRMRCDAGGGGVASAPTPWRWGRPFVLSQRGRWRTRALPQRILSEEAAVTRRFLPSQPRDATTHLFLFFEFQALLPRCVLLRRRCPATQCCRARAEGLLCGPGRPDEPRSLVRPRASPVLSWPPARGPESFEKPAPLHARTSARQRAAARQLASEPAVVRARVVILFSTASRFELRSLCSRRRGC